MVVFLRPTAATMSPVKMSSMSSRWLACIRSSRPIRSFLPVGGVEDRVALGGVARVDPEVGELADVRVGHDLEGQARERLVVARPCASIVSSSSPGLKPSHRRQVDRAGQVARRRRRAAAGRPCS